MELAVNVQQVGVFSDTVATPTLKNATHLQHPDLARQFGLHALLAQALGKHPALLLQGRGVRLMLSKSSLRARGSVDGQHPATRQKPYLTVDAGSSLLVRELQLQTDTAKQ
jgi:hypothetical protein